MANKIDANNWSELSQYQKGFYELCLLTVELNTGQKFLYRAVVQETFDDFMSDDDKDKFYKTHIQFNDGFKRIQLFVWLKLRCEMT